MVHLLIVHALSYIPNEIVDNSNTGTTTYYDRFRSGAVASSRVLALPWSSSDNKTSSAYHIHRRLVPLFSTRQLWNAGFPWFLEKVLFNNNNKPVFFAEIIPENRNNNQQFQQQQEQSIIIPHHHISSFDVYSCSDLKGILPDLFLPSTSIQQKQTILHELHLHRTKSRLTNTNYYDEHFSTSPFLNGNDKTSEPEVYFFQKIFSDQELAKVILSNLHTSEFLTTIRRRLTDTERFTKEDIPPPSNNDDDEEEAQQQQYDPSYWIEEEEEEEEDDGTPKISSETEMISFLTQRCPRLETLEGLDMTNLKDTVHILRNVIFNNTNNNKSTHHHHRWTTSLVSLRINIFDLQSRYASRQSNATESLVAFFVAEKMESRRLGVGEFFENIVEEEEQDENGKIAIRTRKNESILGMLASNLKSLRHLEIGDEKERNVVYSRLNSIPKKIQIMKNPSLPTTTSNNKKNNGNKTTTTTHKQENAVVICERSFVEHLLISLAPMKGRLEKFDFLRKFNSTSGFDISEKAFELWGELFGSSSLKKLCLDNLVDVDLYTYPENYDETSNATGTNSAGDDDSFYVTTNRLDAFIRGCEKDNTETFTRHSKIRQMSFELGHGRLLKPVRFSSSKLQTSIFDKLFSSPSACKYVCRLSLAFHVGLRDLDVKAISENCVMLEVLDLSGCTNLTSLSIEYLCGKNNGNNSCTSLVKDTLQYLQMRNLGSSRNTQFYLKNADIELIASSLWELVCLDLEYSFGFDENSLFKLYRLVHGDDDNEEDNQEENAAGATKKEERSVRSIEYCKDSSSCQDFIQNIPSIKERISTKSKRKFGRGNLRQLNLMLESVSNPADLDIILSPAVIHWGEMFI